MDLCCSFYLRDKSKCLFDVDSKALNYTCSGHALPLITVRNTLFTFRCRVEMNPQHTNTRASIYPKGYTALRASTGQRETSTTTANAMGGGNGSCMFGVTWRLHHCPRGDRDTDESSELSYTTIKDAFAINIFLTLKQCCHKW